jgi:hypothetical protein
MRIRCKAAFVVAMTGAIALAGCDDGGSTGTVAVDPGKDPKLMDAMGGYMNKRKGAGKASAKARPAAEPATPEEPKPAP